MATDIVLDDKMGNSITLSCDEVVATGAVIIDDPISRAGAPPGARVALRHNSRDGLSINPDRDYPDGATIQCANLNLMVHHQKVLTPELPIKGEPGDMFFIRNHDSIADPEAGGIRFVESYTLWVCVGPSASGAADWAPVKFGTPVTGTI